MNKPASPGTARHCIDVPAFIRDRLKREEQRVPFAVEDRISEINWDRLIKRLSKEHKAVPTVNASEA